jgi:predicted RNA-binding Zn-ribbon protein involved in translation (DUF1610 family)
MTSLALTVVISFSCPNCCGNNWPWRKEGEEVVWWLGGNMISLALTVVISFSCPNCCGNS